MRAYDIIDSVQDLTDLEWSERRSSSGTGGMLLKSRTGEGSTLTYYKLSCFDEYRGIYGHECVNEIIASRLMSVLGIKHLSYRLIHAEIEMQGKRYVTWLNSSKSFRNSGEQKQAYDLFYSLNKQDGESPWEFGLRMGWQSQLIEMMLVDFLIANRDRHGANIEVLKGANGSLRLAPLFDNGLSFVFSTFGDIKQAKAFEPLQDIPTNNFIGSKSLQYNIENFVVGSASNPLAHSNTVLNINDLKESDKQKILNSLDKALDPELLEIIWAIIWKRWQWYENLRNS